jgi:hypothetical protein
LRPKTQSLTNIENDLYQRKTAILIPRYSAVWVAVFDSSAQPAAKQFGDTACHEEDSNQSCRHRNHPLEQRPNGLVSCWTDMFGQDSSPSLLLRSPAVVATWRSCKIPWAPVTCTRVETWTSDRGQDCENKQGRSWGISQRADQWRIPGYPVNLASTRRLLFCPALSAFRQGRFSFLMSLPSRSCQ